MGERRINPRFNVNKIYKNVNIINPYRFGAGGGGGGSYDADAQAFIDAVATLSTAQEEAIDDLVVGLKANGTWSKYKAIYPFIGGTASAHKWNLKDPRDLDAAFRLTYGTSTTHNSTGIVNSTNEYYANTHFNPVTASLDLNSSSLSIYKQSVEGSTAMLIGNMGVSVVDGFLLAQFSSGTRDVGLVGSNDYTPSSGSVTSNGLITISTNGSRSAQHYINGATNGSAVTQGESFVSKVLYMGASDTDNLGWVHFASGIFSFATIGDGLTATEVSDDYTTIQAYQTALSRNV